MCAWLAAGLHKFMAATVGHLTRCDGASMWEGLAAMGITHLFMPLDPFADSHVAGAIAPDTAPANMEAHSVRHWLARDQPAAQPDPWHSLNDWTPAPCASFVDNTSMGRLADQRTRALCQASDRKLGRRPAVRFCANFSTARRPQSRPEPSFTLTHLDTVRPLTGATRRNRFRF